MNNQNNYLAYQLREITRFGRIASLYTDPENPDYSIAGFVLATNLRTVLLRSVSPYGKYDGFYSVRVSTIDEVQLDTAYADKLELLLKLNEEKPETIECTDGEDHICTLLQKALREECCATLWTRDAMYSGFIEEADDLRCTIRALDLMGQPFPSMQLRVMDIDVVSIGSEEEKTYERLYRYQNSVGGFIV